jgi:hypothetical protein
MIIISVHVFFFFWFHLYQLSNITDFKQKSKDQLAPWYGLLYFIITSVGAIGFGKPYSPFFVAIGGYVLTIAVGLAYPGTYEWIDKFSSVCTASALLIECWRNVHSKKKVSEGTFSRYHFLNLFKF